LTFGKRTAGLTQPSMFRLYNFENRYCKVMLKLRNRYLRLRPNHLDERASISI